MYKQLLNPKNKLQMLEGVQRIADNAFIPFDPANTDYQVYLEWLAEGNEPLPAEEVNNDSST